MKDCVITGLDPDAVPSVYICPPVYFQQSRCAKLPPSQTVRKRFFHCTAWQTVEIPYIDPKKLGAQAAQMEIQVPDSMRSRITGWLAPCAVRGSAPDREPVLYVRKTQSISGADYAISMKTNVSSAECASSSARSVF
jgi:hypothetical protein